MYTGGAAKTAPKLIITTAAIAGALTLAACSSTSTAPAATTAGETAPQEEAVQAPPAPLDLAGNWEQTNYDGDTIMTAAIQGATITVTYVNASADTTALFWAGSYMPPTDAVDSYSWDSANDTTQTEGSLLASSDATKPFTYSGGVLSFPMTLMGVTKSVELERQ